MRYFSWFILSFLILGAALPPVAVAADLEIGSDEWDKLSDADKAKVTETIKRFYPNGTIVPSKGPRSVAPKLNWCEIACNAAAAACFAECAGAPVCTALCEAGRRECLRHC